MHPISTVLFLIGYALALPIAFRLGRVVSQQHRLALTGHQAGMTIAAIGWLVRGRVPMAVAHLVWIIAVRIWFAVGSQDSRAVVD